VGLFPDTATILEAVFFALPEKEKPRHAGAFHQNRLAITAPRAFGAQRTL